VPPGVVLEWGANVEVGFMQIRCEDVGRFVRLRLLAGSCEHGNELLSFKIAERFLD
jgi:hypothetical protein